MLEFPDDHKVEPRHPFDRKHTLVRLHTEIQQISRSQIFRHLLTVLFRHGIVGKLVAAIASVPVKSLTEPPKFHAMLRINVLQDNRQLGEKEHNQRERGGKEHGRDFEVKTNQKVVDRHEETWTGEDGG